ncbi:MAG: hypothetical protein PGN07_10935 [Aeromicrobium erythreum]
MALRKKKTVRDQVEDRLDDFLSQVSDRAPEVRDRLLERLEDGVADLRASLAEHGPEVAAKARKAAKDGVHEARDRYPAVRKAVLDRVPELSEDTYDKLPSAVAARVPDEVKPKKKRRLRRIALLGLVAGAGAAIFASRRGQNPPPAAVPVPGSHAVARPGRVEARAGRARAEGPGRRADGRRGRRREQPEALTPR